MKKLRLELDEIRVDSFHVQDEAPPPGTVHANQEEAAITGWSWLCGSCNSCTQENTCPWSCAGAAPTGCNTGYCCDKIISEIERCVVDPAPGTIAV